MIIAYDRPPCLWSLLFSLFHSSLSNLSWINADLCTSGTRSEVPQGFSLSQGLCSQSPTQLSSLLPLPGTSHPWQVRFLTDLPILIPHPLYLFFNMQSKPHLPLSFIWFQPFGYTHTHIHYTSDHSFPSLQLPWLYNKGLYSTVTINTIQLIFDNWLCMP